MRSVVSLCAASVRMLAMRACRRDSRNCQTICGARLADRLPGAMPLQANTPPVAARRGPGVVCAPWGLEHVLFRWPRASTASRPPHASAAILPGPSCRHRGQFRMHGGSNRPVQGVGPSAIL
jgi:hypothetical protein